MDVYYTISEGMGCDCLTFVEKDFYDRNQGLDEGVEPEYQDIMDALGEVGCYEMMEAMCEMDTTEDKMIADMAERGFNMIRNDEINS